MCLISPKLYSHNSIGFGFVIKKRMWGLGGHGCLLQSVMLYLTRNHGPGRRKYEGSWVGTERQQTQLISHRQGKLAWRRNVHSASYCSTFLSSALVHACIITHENTLRLGHTTKRFIAYPGTTGRVPSEAAEKPWCFYVHANRYRQKGNPLLTSVSGSSSRKATYSKEEFSTQSPTNNSNSKHVQYLFAFYLRRIRFPWTFSSVRDEKLQCCLMFAGFQVHEYFWSEVIRRLQAWISNFPAIIYYISEGGANII